MPTDREELEKIFGVPPRERPRDACPECGGACELSWGDGGYAEGCITGYTAECFACSGTGFAFVLAGEP